ncbi:MAG TPA: hypothetical protein VFB54_05350 [Burkholderiales bacterium]|nr:hypothetical protein [Burkholderiales bacterium]
MKSQQTLVTTLSLMAILAASSPAYAGTAPDDQRAQAMQSQRDLRAPSRAALAERRLDGVRGRSEPARFANRSALELSIEQMDKVYGGMINNETPPPVPPYGSDGRGVTCRHVACSGL